MKFAIRTISKYINRRVNGEYSLIGSWIRLSVGVTLFLFLLFLQSNVPSPLSGIIAQLQVFISVYLTVSVPYKGYISAIAVNIIEMISSSIAVFVIGYLTALPGVVIPFFTIITISIIYLFGRILLINNRETIKQRDELACAKDKAETATRAKSDFLSAMSHEIRTPMNSILGYLEMIPQVNLTAEQKGYLSIISLNAKNLVSIINDILDFSKLEKGKLYLYSEPFNPADMIRYILKTFELKAHNKNISLTFHCDSQLMCLGDSLRLGQIVTNLVGNSIKFTPEGGSIDVHLSSKYEAPNVVIYIEVRDTGIGIPIDKQQKIFEAFTQSDPATSNKYGGTGLGLTISSNLVEMMGGTLSVESAPGKGCKFYFSIKLPVAETPVSTEQKDTVIEPFRNKKYKALIAEDAPDSLNLMLLMLNKLGISADSAVNGNEAVDLYKKGTYDVVFLDGNMPECNGVEAAKEIRKHESENNLRHTPIIALSAKVLVSEKDEFYQAGADSFVEKPVFLKNLETALHSVLSSTDEKNTAASDNDSSDDIIIKMSEKIGISEEVSTRIISEFFKTSLPEYLKNIRTAVDSADFNEIKNSAHRLKGAAASVMLDKLSAECALLERSAYNEKLPDAAEAAERIYVKAGEAEKLFIKQGH